MAFQVVVVQDKTRIMICHNVKKSQTSDWDSFIKELVKMIIVGLNYITKAITITTISLQ
jgi:hypothetical protein